LNAKAIGSCSNLLPERSVTHSGDFLRRTLTAKGGQARRLAAPPSVAPLRSRCADRSVHHEAIGVFTMTGMRTHALSAAPNRGTNPRPRQPGSSPALILAEVLRSQPPSGSFDQMHAHSFSTSASEGLEDGPSVTSGGGSLQVNERGAPLAGTATRSRENRRARLRVETSRAVRRYTEARYTAT
jgi:hypothetical protein